MFGIQELEKLVTESGEFGHCALTYAAMRETKGLFGKMVIFLATASCRKADEVRGCVVAVTEETRVASQRCSDANNVSVYKPRETRGVDL